MREYEVIVTGGDDLEDLIATALQRAGLKVVSLRSIPDFDAWLATLPDRPVEGLAAAVAAWFNSWGSGGGDYSTETCAQAVCTSDFPRQLARAIYDEISGYSKSPFDAKQLVMEAIESCLPDEDQEGILSWTNR